MIDVNLIGLRELTANLGRLETETRNRLRVFMSAFLIRLREQVKANIAERFRSTGPLYQSVKSELEETTGSITGRVFTDGVAYAGIQEYGGTTPAHDILPVRAMALAFMSPAGLQFKGASANALTIVKRVHHPGSRIPERSYARLALVQLRAPFTDGIRGVVAEAAEAAHLKIAAE